MSYEAKRTVCGVNRAEFSRAAKPMPVTINGQAMVAVPREFSTGSLGWMVTGKLTVEIDGVPCSVQIGLNLTVVGSKELPREVAVAA